MTGNSRHYRWLVLTVIIILSATVLPAQERTRLQLGGLASTTLWLPQAESSPLWDGPGYNSFTARVLFLANFAIDADLTAFANIEAWRGQSPTFYALGLNWRVLKKPVLILRAGRFQAPFGNFLPRRFDSENPLIGRPAAYALRTNLSLNRVPHNWDDLLLTRGRGNSFSYPASSSDKAPGIRLFWRETYLTGLQLLGEGGMARYTLAVTNGSLSNSASFNNSDAMGITARAVVRPLLGLFLGMSFASGAYLNDEAITQDLENQDTGSGAFRQQTFGLDASYSFGHLESWFEWISNSFVSPLLPKKLRTTGFSAEAKYRLSAKIYLAGRFSMLVFNEIPDPNDVDRDGKMQEPWDYPVQIIEPGIGFRIHRNGFAKFSHIFHRTGKIESGDPSDDITAIQFVVFF